MSRHASSDTLKLKIRLAEPCLHAVSGALWDDPRLPELLPEYLFRLYCSARAVVPLMRTAAARSRELASSCPVAAGLVPYLEEHIEEELHHDEWLLEDMEFLGMDRAEVLNRPPDPSVAALVGTLYYWVLHVHPVALMSYFAVVEADPISTRELDGIAERCGISKRGLRTMYEHATLDIEHGDEVFETLDRLPLTDVHHTLLGLTSFVIVEQLSDVIDGVRSLDDGGGWPSTRQVLKGTR